MPSLNAGNLKQLLDTLDHLVPRDRARIVIDQLYPGGKGGAFIANQLGYLRLGIEFLKAGLSDHAMASTGPRPVPMNWKYLVSQKSYVLGFDEFLLDESLELDQTYSEPIRVSKRRRVLVLLFAILLFGIMVLAIIGLVATVSWLNSVAF